MAHPENRNYQEEFQVLKLNEQLSNLDIRIQEMEEKLLFLKEDQARLIEWKWIVINPPHSREISAITVQISSLRSLKRDINKRKDSLTESTRVILSAEVWEAIALTNTEKHSDVTNQLWLLRQDIWKRMDTLQKGWRKSVRDLITKNIKFGEYTYNIHTNEMYDIITEAYLNTKDREWVNNFKESKFKEIWLDVTEEEFLSIFMDACSHMNMDMLDRLKGSIMIITLNGELKNFSADSGRVDKFNYWYQQAIAKAQAWFIDSTWIEINYETAESTNYVLAPKKKVKVPTPTPKPKSQTREVVERNSYSHSNSLNDILLSIQWKSVLAWAAEIVLASEGYEANPYWDYKQWSWWNGTKVPDSIVDKIPKELRAKIEWRKKQPLSKRRVEGIGTISKEDALKDKESHLLADFNGLKKQTWFNQMSNTQKMAILSFAYNLWLPKLTSKWVGLAEALKQWKSNKEIADYIMKYIFADGSKNQWLITRRQFEINILLAPFLEENQRYATVHPKTGVWLWKVTSDLIKELSWDNIQSWVIAVRMERIQQVSLKKWDEVIVSFINNRYIVSLNWTEEFVIDRKWNVSKTNSSKLAMSN